MGGFVAAALGATDVVLSDLSSTIPLLQANVARNAKVCSARVVELKWGLDLPPDLLGSCDVIIGCEIVYQHDEDGICLIAYEFRDSMLADMEFFDRINGHFDVEVVSLKP